MIIDRLLGLLAGNGLVVALTVGLIVMVGAWDRGRIKAAVETGRVEQKQTTEKANATAANNGARSAAGARDPRVRGQVDPTTRRD